MGKKSLKITSGCFVSLAGRVTVLLTVGTVVSKVGNVLRLFSLDGREDEFLVKPIIQCNI